MMEDPELKTLKTSQRKAVVVHQMEKVLKR